MLLLCAVAVSKLSRDVYFGTSLVLPHMQPHELQFDTFLTCANASFDETNSANISPINIE